MALEEIDINASGTISGTTVNAGLLYIGGNEITPSNAFFPSFSATTFSAGTIFSGSTDLLNIFQTPEQDYVQNLIVVGKGGNVDFTSIKDAVDSITGNSSTNRYVIKVGPGKYIEDTIVMKPYVELWGYANYSTIIEVDTPSKDVVILTGRTTINNFVLQGATDNGKSAFSVNGNFGPGVVCEINNCTFGSVNTLLKSNLGAGQFAVIGMNNVNATYFSNFVTGFDINGLGYTTVSCANAKSTIQSSISDFIHIRGANNRIVMTDVGMIVQSALGGSITNFVNAYSGATVDLSSVAIDGAQTGLFIQNIGSAPLIRCSAMNFINSSVKDINILHTGTTGYFGGIKEYSKTFINSDCSFYIFNEDSQIITVAKKGGNFNTINEALAASSGASQDRVYTIKVGPGIYVEPQLNIPSYVNIVSEAIFSTTVIPDGNHHIFTMKSASTIFNMVMADAPIGYAGIDVSDCGVFTLIQECVFNNCDIGIKAQPQSADTYVFLINVEFTGNYNKGIYADSYLGNLINININGGYFYPTISGTTSVFGTGQQTTLNLNSFIIELDGPFSGSGTGVYIENGTKLEANSIDVEGVNYGVHIGNVGTASKINISNLKADNATYDLFIEHPNTNGVVTGIVSEHNKINNASSNIGWTFLDSSDGDFHVTNKMLMSFPNGTTTDISTAILESSTMGLMDGGVLSAGTGFTVYVADGFGYLEQFPDNNVLQKVVWTATSIVLSANSINYLYYNQNEILTKSSSRPDLIYNILLGRVITNSTGIEFIDKSPMNAEHTSNRFGKIFRDGIGPIYSTGSLISEGATSFTLNITPGHYFFTSNEFMPSGGTGVTFTSVYRDGLGGHILSSTTVVDNNYYDANTGTLSGLTASAYTKHSFYVIGEGVSEKYYLVYGQNQYSSLLDAENGGLPSPPNYFSDSMSLISTIIVRQGATNITEILDNRPIIGFRSQGISTAASTHGELLGLTADDHLQYLLVNGSRAMAGNFNVGGNNIISAGTINGVTIQNHSSRHLPNGADPLSSATAVSITNVNQEGIANSFSRSDHRHAHGTHSGGTTHANATTSVAGFMSASDKAFLDNIPNIANTKANLSGATFTGGIIAPSLSATTISGGTIYSGTTNLYDIFHQKNGYLLQKAGMVSGSTFAGNPKKATVTFSTNFPNNNYSISVVGMVSRSWSIESKTLSGFTINSNANAAFSSDEVYWQTTENGEGAK